MANKDTNTVSFKFSDDELSLFKNTFCENNELMRLVSNVFMQLELSDSDKAILTTTFKGKTELLALMRKKLIAELDPNAPLGLNSDIWKEVKIDNALPEFVLLDMQSKLLVLNLLEEGLKRLADINYEPTIKMDSLVKFTTISDPQDVYVNIKARNEFLMHITSQMFNILGLAGKSNETVEAIKKRLQTNSTK